MERDTLGVVRDAAPSVSVFFPLWSPFIFSCLNIINALSSVNMTKSEAKSSALSSGQGDFQLQLKRRLALHTARVQSRSCSPVNPLLRLPLHLDRRLLLLILPISQVMLGFCLLAERNPCKCRAPLLPLSTVPLLVVISMAPLVVPGPSLRPRTTMWCAVVRQKLAVLACATTRLLLLPLQFRVILQRFAILSLPSCLLRGFLEHLRT